MFYTVFLRMFMICLHTKISLP